MTDLKAKILVVEDEGIVANDLKLSLNTLGYDVVSTTPSGESAVHKAQELSPDLVLMDIVLKGEMDGIEAADIINSKYDIPIVFLTAHSEVDVLDRAKLAEPFGYILKPFEENGLRAAIEIALYKNQQEKVFQKNKSSLLFSLNFSEDAIITVDNNGRVVSINPLARSIGGWSRGEIEGRGLRDVLVLSSGESNDQVEALIKSLKDIYYENNAYLKTHHSEIIKVEVFCIPILGGSGETEGAVCVLKEISWDSKDMANLELELKASETSSLDFNAVLVHDLREPLRKIRSFGELLKREYEEALNSRGKEYLQRMANAVDRMEGLLDNLLELTKAGSASCQLDPIDLKKVVSEVLVSLELLVNRTRGRVEVKSLPKIEANELLMLLLFQNLISNALKFHAIEETPIVTIDSNLLDNGFWEITVTDNGIGIDEKNVGRIFEPFERLHGASEFVGEGIGLATCSKIVTRHAGSIRAKSQPGKGTTIIIALPEKQSKRI